MPDITKCTNEDCERKNDCFRFTSMPSEFQQSYQKFEPNPFVQWFECLMFILNDSSGDDLSEH